MNKERKPNGYWNIKENVLNEALKYTTRKEFIIYSVNAYRGAIRNNWIDEAYLHMIELRKPDGHWTKEKCAEEALKYDNCTDFKVNSGSACCVAIRNKWMEDITSHFITKGHRYKRFIYAYEFPYNHVYVGLTYNFSKRQSEHNIKGTVYDYIKESDLTPKFVELIQEPVDVEKAKELEEFYLQGYKNNGWVALNKKKTGGIGGTTIKLTKELCQERALDCATRGEFEKKYSTSYDKARKKGWLSEICSHMKEVKKPKGYWTFETCKEVSKLYKNRSSFKVGSSGAHGVCRINNWLDIFFP